MIAALIFGKEQTIYNELMSRYHDYKRDAQIQMEKEKAFAEKIAAHQANINNHLIIAQQSR